MYQHLEKSVLGTRQFIQSQAAFLGILNDPATQILLDALDDENKTLPISSKAMLCLEFLWLVKDIQGNGKELIDLIVYVSNSITHYIYIRTPTE